MDQQVCQHAICVVIAGILRLHIHLYKQIATCVVFAFVFRCHLSIAVNSEAVLANGQQDASASVGVRVCWKVIGQVTVCLALG